MVIFYSTIFTLWVIDSLSFLFSDPYIHWPFGYLIFDSLILWLFYSLTLWFFDSLILWLSWLWDLLTHGYMTILLFYCLVLWLLHPLTLRLYDCLNHWYFESNTKSLFNFWETGEGNSPHTRPLGLAAVSPKVPEGPKL